MEEKGNGRGQTTKEIRGINPITSDQPQGKVGDQTRKEGSNGFGKLEVIQT